MFARKRRSHSAEKTLSWDKAVENRFRTAVSSARLGRLFLLSVVALGIGFVVFVVGAKAMRAHQQNLLEREEKWRQLHREQMTKYCLGTRIAEKQSWNCKSVLKSLDTVVTDSKFRKYLLRREGYDRADLSFLGERMRVFARLYRALHQYSCIDESNQGFKEIEEVYLGLQSILFPWIAQKDGVENLNAGVYGRGCINL